MEVAPQMTETYSSPPTDAAGFADHVQDTVETLAEFHRAHHRGATRLQLALDRLTGALGRPMSMIVILTAVAAWLGIGWADGGLRELSSLGWLELLAAVSALAITVLILITQRREDELAERRARLTLELALLSDRKSAKIIALLEEMRRDHPHMVDRFDAESEAMAKPSDTDQVLAAIDLRASEPA